MGAVRNDVQGKLKDELSEVLRRVGEHVTRKQQDLQAEGPPKMAANAEAIAKLTAARAHLEGAKAMLEGY